MNTYKVNGFIAELNRESPDGSEGLENLAESKATSVQSLLKTIRNLANIDLILGVKEYMVRMSRLVIVQNVYYDSYFVSILFNSSICEVSSTVK